MKWTAQEREQIVLAYAHEGVAFCPDDLEPLKLVPASQAEVNHPRRNSHLLSLSTLRGSHDS